MPHGKAWFEVHYKDGSGKDQVHECSNNRAQADGWARNLHDDHGGKVTVYENLDGGGQREVSSLGDANDRTR